MISNKKARFTCSIQHIEIELGSKHNLFQVFEEPNDNKETASKALKGSNSHKLKAYEEEEIGKHGNEDSKKLYTAYKELSKDGLSAEEIKKLNKLDETLKGAEFSCLESAGTLIAQAENNEETVFVVQGNTLGKHLNSCGKGSRKM